MKIIILVILWKMLYCKRNIKRKHRCINKTLTRKEQKRAKKSNKIIYCNIYKNQFIYQFMSINLDGLDKNNFECKICNFKCTSRYNFSRHNDTAKHKKMLEKEQKRAKQEELKQSNEVGLYKCEECNKTYKKYNSYWYHARRCKKPNATQLDLTLLPSTDLPREPDHSMDTLTNIVKELVAQNQELKQMIVEKNTTNVTNQNYLINNNNNGTINNKFNLNFFLNEECKNAFNITDYINSIQLQLEDLETTAELGYAGGITKIISDRVKDCGLYQRPFHCMDSKREIVYVKDNDVWEKENSDKPRMRKMITNVIHKNIQQLSKWHEKYPECLDSNNNKSAEYLNIMIEANGGQEREKKEEQILKNILKEVLVEK